VREGSPRRIAAQNLDISDACTWFERFAIESGSESDQFAQPEPRAGSQHIGIITEVVFT
jgi:hypothetical protein